MNAESRRPADAMTNKVDPLMRIEEQMFNQLRLEAVASSGEDYHGCRSLGKVSRCAAAADTG